MFWARHVSISASFGCGPRSKKTPLALVPVRKSTSELGAPKYSDLGRISTDSAHSWTRRQLQAHPRRPPRIY